MNEFKFSCPNCHQNLQATPEYSGAQINCPNCQTLLVVPPAPSGGPVPLPAATKLSMAASTATHTATPTPFIAQGPPVRKKKNHTNTIVGLILAAGAVSAGINFGPSLYAKYFHHEEPAPVAAAAPTNEPPPPPPELTSDEILQKVADAYKNLNTLAIKGQAAAAIDASQLNRATPNVQNSTTTVALQLGRANYYRLEWERSANGTRVKGAAWDSGKGDFVGYGSYPPNKMKNRQTTLATASGASATLANLIAELFFSETNNLTSQADAFTRTNGTKLNGQNCYILNGQLQAHNIVLWVNKTTFLIPQIEFDFGGKLDEAALKQLAPAERDKFTRMSKLKGNIVETYENLETNLNLIASSFESAYVPSAGSSTANATPTQAGGREKRRPTMGATSPTQLTRRVTDPQ
jgi:hypothetical protein